MSALHRTALTVVARTRMGFQETTQYRGELLVWAGASVLQTLVYLVVWRAVAHETGTTAGYSAAQFAGYFVALLLVRELTYSWVPYDLPGQVRDGRLAPKLLRPGHPLGEIFGQQLSVRLTHLVLLIPTAAVLFMLFDARIEVDVVSVAAWLLVIPLASLVRYLVDSLVACTSLWLVKIDGIVTLYYLGVLFLSGQFAPIAVLPGPVRDVARALPFYWTLGFPVELLVGRADGSDAWIGLLVLAGWALFLLVVVRGVWRAGTRAFEAVGQ